MCFNYRPIMLLNIAYEIFTIILNNRLSKLVECKLSEAQVGFRSTLDNIYIISQTFDKCYEYNTDLHNIFLLLINMLLTQLRETK
jgi:sorting nexin-29